MIENSYQSSLIYPQVREIYKSTRILMTSIIAFNKLYKAYKFPNPDIQNNKNESYPMMLNRILNQYNKKLKEFTNIFIRKKLIPEFEMFKTKNPPKFSTKLDKIYEELCHRYYQLFSNSPSKQEKFKIKADVEELSFTLGIDPKAFKSGKEEPGIPKARVYMDKNKRNNGGLMSIAESVIENNIVFESMDFSIHPPGPLNVDKFRREVHLRKSKYISKSNEKSKKRTQQNKHPHHNDFLMYDKNKNLGGGNIAGPGHRRSKSKRELPRSKREKIGDINAPFDYVNMRKCQTGQKSKEKREEFRENQNQNIRNQNKSDDHNNFLSENHRNSGTRNDKNVNFNFIDFNHNGSKNYFVNSFKVLFKVFIIKIKMGLIIIIIKR